MKKATSSKSMKASSKGSTSFPKVKGGVSTQGGYAMTPVWRGKFVKKLPVSSLKVLQSHGSASMDVSK